MNYLSTTLKQANSNFIVQCLLDEALFDLEMKYIFEGNWVYLAHESQIPDNNDYYTTYLAISPILIARNRNR